MRSIEIVVAICSCLSVVGSLLLLISYAFSKELRRHPTQLVAFIAFCDLLFNGKFLLSVAMPHEWQGKLPDHASCFISSVMGQFFGVASLQWNLVMALNMILTLRNPFAYTANYYFFYHLNAWGWALITTVIMVAFDQWGSSNFGGLCWIKSGSSAKQNNFELLYIIPLILADVVSILSVAFYVHRLFLMSDNEDYNMHRQRRLRRMIFYVFLFIVCRSIFIVQYLVQDSWEMSETLMYMNIIGTTVHAFLNSVLWFTQQSFIVWYKRMYSLKEVDQEDGSIIEPLIRENTARASTHINDDASLLRKDVMGLLYVGIIHSVEETVKIVRTRDFQEMDSPRDHRESSSSLPHTNPTSGSRTTSRFSLIRPSDYNVKTEHILFNSIGEKKRGLILSDYAPIVFHNLRKLSQVSPYTYKESIKGELYLPDSDYGKFSDGKSGSFFCVTADKRFVVKTITKQESELLSEILPHYYNYISANPDSLIIRFMGSYAFRIYEAPNIYFLVMKNILYTDFPLHLRFDIKGSWVNRATDDYDMRKVGKDLDLNDHFVELEQDERQQLMSILRRDSQFLAQMNLMDYSLLLGIHLKNMPTQLPRGMRAGSFTRNDLPSLSSGLKDSFTQATVRNGTLSGIDTRCIMGIIDILQRYTLRKKLERFIKTKILRADEHGVSVSRPEYYAVRFFEKMASVFISSDDVLDGSDQSPPNSAVFIFSENYKTKIHGTSSPLVHSSISASSCDSISEYSSDSIKMKRDGGKRISMMTLNVI